MGKPAAEEGGAGGGRRVADSSLWKIRLTDTHTRRTRPPAPLLLSREAPARTTLPPFPGALRARPPQRKFFSSEAPEPSRAFGKRGTEEAAAAAQARGVHVARRLGCLSGGPRGGVGLSPAASSRLSRARNLPGLSRGSPLLSPPCPGSWARTPRRSPWRR